MVAKSTTYTAAVADAEFLVSEASGLRSREEIVLAQDADAYVAGTVLEDVGDGTHTRFDGATGTAVGILMLGVDAVTADEKATAVVRDAEIRSDALVYLDAATQGHKDAALASLAALGIIARETVTGV